MISYDRPGYGGSTPQPGRTVASAAEDIAIIAEALGLRRLLVWGISGGGIWNLRVAADGGTIYFSSDNAHLYTPASRNLFRVAADGGWWDQITPGPNSGRWNQGCPCGTVTGTVRKSNGDPWGNSPVYLEGKGQVNSHPDGSFRFDAVPAGVRWIIAYRPGDSSVFDASSGAALGAVYFPQDYTLSNVSLHGWSPDGRWLLYSAWLNDVSTGALAKLPVNSDGSLNPAGAVMLLSNTRISGAAWGQLEPTAAPGQRSYLPIVTR